MKKLSFSLLTVLLVLFFSKCTLQEDLNKLQGSLDSLQLVLSNPEFNTSVQLEFIDAKTNTYIKGKTVKVTIGGKNASDLYNNLATKQSVYSSSVGYMLFVIDPRKIDSTKISSEPLEFTVTTEIDGYLDATQKIFIHKIGENREEIKLINTATPPAGVSIAVNNNFTTTLNGMIATTGTQTMNGGEQTVVIPKGTVLKDASGNVVNGTVKTEIVYFDPKSPDAVGAFPGGANVSVVRNNQEEQVQFISAGMFNVNVTAGGTDVKSFTGGGVTLKTSIPSTLINPKTGQPVKNGDVIELWSLDEGSGEWKFEKTDTIRLVGGKLVLEETVTHLSSWNWDWDENTCYEGVKFVFSGETGEDEDYFDISIHANGLVSNFSELTYEQIYPNNQKYNNITLRRTPANSKARITFDDPYHSGAEKLTFSPSSIDIDNLCSGQTYNITITDPKVANRITVNFDLSATSKSNALLLVRPSTTVNYYNNSSYRYKSFSLVNGRGSAYFTPGVDYTFDVTFGSNYESGSIRIDKVNETTANVTYTRDIDFNSSAPQTKVTVPVAITNNTINVVYKAVLSDDILNSLQ